MKNAMINVSWETEVALAQELNDEQLTAVVGGWSADYYGESDNDDDDADDDDEDEEAVDEWDYSVSQLDEPKA